MMDALRSWILCLAGTAMLAACALALAPEGPAKRAVRLACGFAAMLALLSAVRGFDYAAYASSLSEYRQKADAAAASASERAGIETRAVIEKRCAEYISDKAENAGAPGLSVAVTAKWSADGYWYPASVRISGAAAPQARQALSRAIEAELGIPAEAQTWSTDDG